MKNGIEVLNFGSLNIDHVYKVERFVRPGETMACLGYEKYAGGKGLNQSVALARAGVEVAHAGCVGEDGGFLVKTLAEAGADTGFVRQIAEATGHACIQVDEEGQNSILLYPGVNRKITEGQIVAVLDSVAPGTILVLQNEINLIPFLIREAKKRDLTVAFNPAPCTDEVSDYPLELVDILFVNELEAEQLSGLSPLDPNGMLDELAKQYPACEIILTLGGDGALYARKDERIKVTAAEVAVVDTTGAGDTFCAYFVAAKLRGFTPEQAMAAATLAAGISVGRAGAAVSIPFAGEVFTV